LIIGVQIFVVSRRELAVEYAVQALRGQLALLIGVEIPKLEVSLATS
jgi:hypothetical protein